MPASFFSLPSELRNEIYKHVLVCREPISPWSRENQPTPNLLSTNKTILRETSPLLYGKNCFDLTTWNSEMIPQFYDAIGFVNASHIQGIRINFPEFRELKDQVSLQEDSLHTLEKIQSYCTNLKSLTTNPTIDIMECQRNSFDSPAKCCRALALVAAQLRRITSLQEIVVEVYEADPSSDIQKTMHSHGWTLKLVEPVEHEEWDDDRGWDDIEDDDYYDDDDEDYDIDNDSDFWRRAAD